MTSTTTAFLAVSQNLSRYQAMTAAEPAVKTATAYYEANIGSVKSIKDLVGNYRLLSYALNAYGLGDQINAKGLITKVLEGGVSNPKSLANTLPQLALEGVRRGFQFRRQRRNFRLHRRARLRRRRATMSNSSWRAIRATRTWASQLALYFQRVAPTVTNEYGILADPNLLQVAADDHGALAGGRQHDLQPQTLSELMPLSDLQDPAKLNAADRAVHRDVRLTYGPSSGATSDLTVDSGNSTLGPVGRRRGSRRASSVQTARCWAARSTTSPARRQPIFSTALMSSMSRLSLGG